jgi:hypothetical protein
MAVGDDAAAGGYPLVPNTGAGAEVRNGALEINRTRDFIALLKKLIPTSKSGFRTSAGITTGTATPSNSTGDNGDIYLRQI